ncbi:uncharacterized protein [Nicotiana tomentosiformis]|uniref:uncharacterized protein n=1 Tax=Nicotiana tomentosiformis TaxID=4098 RepID=UPI00388C8C47
MRVEGIQDGDARPVVMLSPVGLRQLHAVIIDIVPVCHRDISVLFDPGSTYSYVPSYFASNLDMYRDSLSTPVYVSIPIGNSIAVDRVYHSWLVTIGVYKTGVDLLLLNMVNFDVNLDMDWLSPNHAILDCHTKTMMLAIPRLPMLEWRGSLGDVPWRVVSFLKAQRMAEKGYLSYLAFMRDVITDTPTIELVPIVREFPVDLLGMPLDRDIDFDIDLVPCTQPISIPPYRMALVELKELTKKL